MKDLNIIFGDFNTTTITVEALSKRGKSLFAKEFGQGAVSITLPKSKAPDFTEYAANNGLVWQTFTHSAYSVLYPHKVDQVAPGSRHSLGQKRS